MGAFGLNRENGLVTLTLAGHITMDVTGEIKRALIAALEHEDCLGLVLELSAVTFLDSSGIGVLIAANSRMRGRGRPVYLLKPSPQVLKTLEMVQILPYFQVILDLAAIPAADPGPAA